MIRVIGAFLLRSDSCFLAVVFSLFVVNAPVVPNTVFSISYVSLS